MKRPCFLIGLLSLVLCPICALAQPSDMERTYAEAQKALAAGDMDGALRKFEQLSRANPKIAEIHATIGAIRFQQKDFVGALKELDQAKQLKPTLPKIEGLIAMSQAELGRYKEALPELEETFKTSQDAPVKRLSGLQLERAYTATKQDRNAVAVALELQTLFPEDPEVLYHNERIFGNFAYLTVRKLNEVAPNSIWLHQAQAEAEESQRSHDVAIATYRQILQLDPQHHGIHYRIGRCLRERARDLHHPEDLSAAMNEFQTELKLDPENANAAYEVGELHRLAGELEPARSYFEAALRLYPDFPEANLGLGTVLASLNQPADALPFLKQAVAKDPGDEATWYRLSQVERALGHTAAQRTALEVFRKLHDHTVGAQHQPTSEVTRQKIDSDTP